MLDKKNAARSSSFTLNEAAVWPSGCGVGPITAKVWVRFRPAARAIGASPRAGSPACPQCGCVGPDGVESSLGPQAKDGLLQNNLESSLDRGWKE